MSGIYLFIVLGIKRCVKTHTVRLYIKKHGWRINSSKFFPYSNGLVLRCYGNYFCQQSLPFFDVCSQGIIS